MQAKASQTPVVAVDSDQPDSEAIRHAADVLRHGGLVAFATETVYGLGVVATDPKAVAGIFAAKGRPSFNPLIVHVATIEQAKELVDHWPDLAQKLAEQFWPGPLTLVLTRSSVIPDIVTAGQSTVAIRIPAPRVARSLIQAAGLPIAAPSANRSNRISPTRAEHVLADLDSRIDLILDSGPTSVGLESTVLDLTGDQPKILRPGPIPASQLLEFIESTVPTVDVGGLLKKIKKNEPKADLVGKLNNVSAPLSSPGQLPVHYAPQTRAVRVEPSDQNAPESLPGRVALLELGSFRKKPRCEEVGFVRLETPEEAGRRLYDVLHRFDDLRPDLIAILMPPNLPEWSAVRDRLERATVPVGS